MGRRRSQRGALVKRPGLLRMLLAAGPLLLVAACSAPPPDAPDPGAPQSAEAARLAESLDGDPREWVTVYDPERAANGYTLGLYQRRIPILFDMNGRIVHAWPEARVRSRVRLLPNGHLLGIALGRAVVEYDWEGNLVWEYGGEEVLPHHDVIRLANGNTLLVVSAPDRRTDDLLEVDRAGRVVWRWRSEEHLAYYWRDTPAGERDGDITHVNSVQELPPNRHYRSGDRRFRPGNLLISARNLNAVFLIDRQTGQVVWTYDTELDLQHEALMVPIGYPGHGRIQLFNNNYRNTYEYRKSVVLEIEPDTGEILWRYRRAELYSPTGGVQQALPNGNVLIGSTRGGRAFEVARGGEIVWQWVPPFDPVRPARYPYDHCPQLAALGRPTERPVAAPPGYRYVDKRVYQFAPAGAIREVVVDGRQRRFLADNNQCRQMLLPTEPSVTVLYGLHRRKLQRLGRDQVEVRFQLQVKPADSDEAVELLADTVDLEGRIWRGWTLDLAPWALSQVELCVSAEEVGADGPTEEFAYWASPAVQSGASEAEASGDDDDELDPLTPEELEVRRQHLRTLGYID